MKMQIKYEFGNGYTIMDSFQNMDGIEIFVKNVNDVKEKMHWGDEAKPEAIADNAPALATERQLKVLRASGIEPYPGMTKSDAYNAIAQIIAEKEKIPAPAPATEKQKALMVRLGIAFDDGTTKAQAFDMIKAAVGNGEAK